MSGGSAPLVAALTVLGVGLWLRPAVVGRVPSVPRTPGQEGPRRPVPGRRAGGPSDLPHLVGLVASGVEAGAPVPTAVIRACEAFAEAHFEELRAAADKVARGADPGVVWGAVTSPAAAPLARTLARSSRTGASVVRSLALLAEDLADEARSGQEDAARRVGVRAALPLGICLLPAFLLLGIVPLVAGLAAQIVAP